VNYVIFKTIDTEKRELVYNSKNKIQKIRLSRIIYKEVDVAYILPHGSDSTMVWDWDDSYYPELVNLYTLSLCHLR